KCVCFPNPCPVSSFGDCQIAEVHLPGVSKSNTAPSAGDPSISDNFWTGRYEPLVFVRQRPNHPHDRILALLAIKDHPQTDGTFEHPVFEVTTIQNLPCHQLLCLVSHQPPEFFRT